MYHPEYNNTAFKAAIASVNNILASTLVLCCCSLFIKNKIKAASMARKKAINSNKMATDSMNNKVWSYTF